MGIEELIKTIIQCAYNVRVIELKEKGIYADTETPIHVYYKNE